MLRNYRLIVAPRKFDVLKVAQNSFQHVDLDGSLQPFFIT